jgi:hypothetical protein
MKAKKQFVLLTRVGSGWDLVDTTSEENGEVHLTIYDSRKEAQAEIDEMVREMSYSPDEFKIIPYQRGVHEQKWLEDSGNEPS